MNLKAVPLSYLSEVRSGGGAPQESGAFTDTGHPFVRAGSLSKLLSGDSEESLEKLEPSVADKHGLTLFPAGTVLFAKSGMSATMGHIYRLRQPAYVVNHLAALVPHDPSDSAFLMRALQRFSPTSLIKDPTYPSIRLGDIENMKVFAPEDPAERLWISEILERADALRTKRGAALAQLDILTQAVFLDLFGDPISNPRKWPQENLETLFHFRTGKLDSNAAVASGRYPFFTCSREDFRIDTYAFDCEALLLAGNNASADYSVKRYKGKFNAYQRTYVITLQNEHNSYEYAQFVLEHRLAVLKRISKGTNTKYLTMELLNRILVPVPPEQLQREFARRLAAIEKLKAAHRDSIAETDALFASLQQRAFRGEL